MYVHRVAQSIKDNIFNFFLKLLEVVKSIKIHTCDWNNAHTYDKVELKIENSKGECNTHQLSNRKNFVYGDKDIFNDNKAALNECFDWPINGNITVTVSKWGTDDWPLCWAKINYQNGM